MSTTRAIILAAGMGTRLAKYTSQLPKGMLQFNGKTLIERQINTLRESGITDISIVTGYQSSAIHYPGITYFHNERFSTTNMLESLMCAKEKFDNDSIVSYADIIYTPPLVKAISNSPTDIAVAVDESWREYWTQRYGTTETDLESLSVLDNRIVEIGKPVTSSKDLHHRYIGLLKFSKSGFNVVQDLYERKRLKNEAWIQSGKPFELGYMTDLLHEIIQNKGAVVPVTSNRGWMEFDTNEDYEVQTDLANKGLIDPYFMH
jgi:choline kinase